MMKEGEGLEDISLTNSVLTKKHKVSFSTFLISITIHDVTMFVAQPHIHCCHAYTPEFPVIVELFLPIGSAETHHAIIGTQIT